MLAYIRCFDGSLAALRVEFRTGELPRALEVDAKVLLQRLRDDSVYLSVEIGTLRLIL